MRPPRAGWACARLATKSRGRAVRVPLKLLSKGRTGRKRQQGVYQSVAQLIRQDNVPH